MNKWFLAQSEVRLTMLILIILIAMFVASADVSLPLGADTLSSQQQFAHDVYKELLEINTVTATGDTGRAADAMAARLRAAGFPESDVHVFKPAPGKGNLVAILSGTGARRPILLVAHLDVVEARREDWSFDPFKLIEQNGYYYARGSSDDKFMAATFVSNLIRYKQEGYRPDRDIKMVLETDEEILDRYAVGMQWVIRNHRDLIDAEFALNEGGGVSTRNGKALRNNIQISEKVPCDFSLEVTNPGGHSSVPSKDNAIYHLAGGLVRLSQFDFPVKLNDTTRSWFRQGAAFEEKQAGADMLSVASANPDPAAIARLSAKPAYNAELRTTCVATLLAGGHADNALPQRAQATVNCRVLPGESIDDVQKALTRVRRQADCGQAHVDPRSEPAVAAQPRSFRSDQASDCANVAGNSGNSCHEHRRNRRQLSPQRWHPHVRHLRRRYGSGRYPCAWPR